MSQFEELEVGPTLLVQAMWSAWLGKAIRAQRMLNAGPYLTEEGAERAMEESRYAQQMAAYWRAQGGIT